RSTRSKPQPTEPSPEKMCERFWTLPFREHLLKEVIGIASFSWSLALSHFIGMCFAALGAGYLVRRICRPDEAAIHPEE
ncbi:hypothetical protein, partial [Halovulum marinum]|uniref:hypothetical protein n=1 Tax=Halovulum marinum TaxID=2662447 RepID=UPI001F3BCE23